MAYKDKGKMTKYVNDFNRENYDRIGLMAPKGIGGEIKAAASAAGMSANAYILQAVREKMSRDAAAGEGGGGDSNG